MELMNIVNQSEKALKKTYEGVSHNILNIVKSLDSGEKETVGNKTFWIENVSDKIDFLCLVIFEENRTYRYLFTIEKEEYAANTIRCFKFFKDWDEDFSKLELNDFVSNFNHYIQYTDEIPANKYKPDRPSLQYFKDNILKMDEDRYFQSPNKLFEFSYANLSVMNDIPDLKTYFLKNRPELFEPNADFFVDYSFHRNNDISRVVDALQELNDLPSVFDGREKKLNKSISRYVEQHLFGLCRGLNKVIKICSKNKASSKEKAFEGHYTKAWSFTKSKKKFLVLDFSNFESFTFVFVFDSKTPYLFECYRVFSDWKDESFSFGNEFYIQSLHEFVENLSDYNEKPTLDMLIKNFDNYKPIFSVKERGDNYLYKVPHKEYSLELHTDSFIKNSVLIDKAIGLFERF